MAPASDTRRSVKLGEQTYRALIGFKADLEKALGEEFSLSDATDYLVAAASASNLVESLCSVLQNMSQRRDKFESYFELRELEDQLKRRDLLAILKKNLSSESREWWETKEKQTSEVGSNSSPNVLERSRFEIWLDMLMAVMEGAEGPTQIMYKANISWTTLQQYLKTLVDNGSLRWVENGNRKGYELTPKGQAALATYFDLLRESKAPEKKITESAAQMQAKGKTAEGDT